MGLLADALQDAKIEVSTPDETGFGLIKSKYEFQFWFAPGYFAHASEAQVCAKTAVLGRLGFAAWLRHYYAAKSRAIRQEVRGPAKARTPAEQSRRDQIASIQSVGYSDDENVRVTSIGMLSWQVEVRPGVFQGLTEGEFCKSAAQAARWAVDDHMHQLRSIRFGIPLMPYVDGRRPQIGDSDLFQ